MSKLTNSEIFEITHQSDVDSYPYRTNYSNIKNRHNQGIDEIRAASVGTTNAETTAARPYHASLNEKLNTIELGRENYVSDGFEVSVNGTDATYIDVSAGSATVAGTEVQKGFGTWARSATTVTITENGHGRSNGNTIVMNVSSDVGAIPLQEYTIANVTTNTFTITGVDTGATTGSCEFSSILGAITNPTVSRYDIVVINSDNSLSVVVGNDSADRVNPNIASTQRPLAVIDAQTMTVFVVSESDITDISSQGVIAAGRWYFSISSALAGLDDRTNSVQIADIYIKKGNYYEEVDLSGINNISLIYENGAKHYRPDNSSYCIKNVNTVSNETVGIKIIGGDFYGNSKTGAIEILKFEYTDEFLIKDCRFDSNNSSTATYKNWLINQSDNFHLDHNLNLDNSGDIDYAETGITNATNYMEDGYYKDQVTYCGVTAQKAQMLKQGWIELTAMDDKFLRIDKDTAAATGGNDNMAHTHLHKHQWYKYNNDKDVSDQSYNAGGTLENLTNKNYGTTGTGISINAKAKSGLTESMNQDYFGSPNNQAASNTDNKPAYYTLIALIHR